jgi:hypothetical protein
MLGIKCMFHVSPQFLINVLFLLRKVFNELARDVPGNACMS